MGKTLPVEYGAEAFIELLNANHVDYIFINPGSDTFPIQEAIAKFKELLGRYRALRVFMEICVRCGACYDTCQFFRGTGDPKGIGATRELPVENQERKPSEMIPVKVADQNRDDLAGIDFRSLERDERRCTAVDEARMPVRFGENAGLQATAAPERVATPQESNSHACHDSPSCGLTADHQVAVDMNPIMGDPPQEAMSLAQRLR